ncbi:hypothetical protein [Mesorhizobium sp. WSM3862]|uniref:hypothetical protein n=1 Tax=Mesorhizobium sp. WSM3862 TaxID=632858 RepID=UPI000BAED271|nr:hypothetical protein [Mesorhizobium sp. WSM3862]PBB95326.1 hypothetical protein CK224_27140 [Mesorhizobium sp. WSM3862]
MNCTEMQPFILSLALGTGKKSTEGGRDAKKATAPLKKLAAFREEAAPSLIAAPVKETGAASPSRLLACE